MVCETALYAVANSICNFGERVVVLAQLKITLNPPAVFELAHTEDSNRQFAGGKNCVGLQS